MEVRDGSKTRTSTKWSSIPGGMRSLNQDKLFDGEPPWGIPRLDPVVFRPKDLVAWCESPARLPSEKEGLAWHLFLDDYRIERAWSRPTESLRRAQILGAAIGPDFSLYTDWPLAMNLWNIYRAAWVCRWWQINGIQVVPSVSWAGPETYSFAWNHIPSAATVAVSTVGVRELENFRRGLNTMLDSVRPILLLWYGKNIEPMPSGIEVVRYHTAMKKWRR